MTNNGGQIPKRPKVAEPQPAAPTTSMLSEPISIAQQSAVPFSLVDQDLESTPANYKRQGDDWFAIFNRNVPRQLDVSILHTFEHPSVVCCVRFSADGKFIATGCNKSAQIFDVKTGQKVVALVDEGAEREGDLYIRSVCFSPDGLYLATGAEDKIIRIWDILKKKIKNQFVGHEQDIYSLDFSRDGTRLASGSGDRTARLWDMESGQNLLTLQIEDGVTTVAVSPDGKFLAAGSLDRHVRVWDTERGTLVERLEGHKDSVYSVAFSPSGLELLSGSLDKTIKLWELTAPRSMPGMLPGGTPRAGACKTTFVGHKDFVLSVALSPDGKWVVSGSKDRGVQFWNPVDGQPQFMLQGHKNSGTSRPGLV
jgi:general transcriptional corepressor TUP1